MFKIIELTKRICIPCRYFNKNVDINEILILLLNKNLFNQIIYNAGLFIIVTSIENHQILPAIMNKSEVFVNVCFQCLVFTLIEGEVLTAKINDCSPAGLLMNIGFFKSIMVDNNYLPNQSKYEYNGKRWIWIKKMGIDEYYFPINVNDDVRFKVLETKFQKFNLLDQERSIEPMTTYGTIKQELLGPILWWKS